MNDLKTKILHTVKHNNIAMIPRWKFVLYSVLGIVGIIFIFFLAVFVLSLIFFVLSRYGFMYLPFFGFLATLHALRAIPLLLLVCTIVLLVIIELISRSYSFSFRRPLAVTLLILTSCAVVASFFVSELGIHDYVRGYARNHHIVMMERMYERPLPLGRVQGDIGILRGEVVTSTPTTTVLRLFDGATVVAYASTTRGDYFIVPSVGDDVMIFGNTIDGHFEIMNIRTTPVPPFGYRMHMRGMMYQNSNNVPTISE
jgi:hypothetical protein